MILVCLGAAGVKDAQTGLQISTVASLKGRSLKSRPIPIRRHGSEVVGDPPWELLKDVKAREEIWGQAIRGIRSEQHIFRRGRARQRGRCPPQHPRDPLQAGGELRGDLNRDERLIASDAAFQAKVWSQISVRHGSMAACTNRRSATPNCRLVEETRAELKSDDYRWRAENGQLWGDLSEHRIG